MVSKPKQRRLIVKSLGRDPRNTSTAANARHTLHTTPSITSSNSKYAGKKNKLFTLTLPSLAKKKYGPEPEPVSSNTRTGSVERRLLAFYTEYRPEKLLEVDDLLLMYSGREEELFAALVKKYGPEPVGPNYKSRNGNHKTVAEARDDLHSTQSHSWSDMSPDSEIEVPMKIRIRVPKDDETEVDRDLLEEEEFLESFQLDLATERACDEMAREMMHNSYSWFCVMFDCGDTRGSESLNEHMVDFLLDRHLVEVETWEDEESLASC